MSLIDLDKEFRQLVKKELPPSWVNNSRAIVEKMWEKFNSARSNWRRDELVSIVEGLCIDFDDGDVCAEARGEWVN